MGISDVDCLGCERLYIESVVHVDESCCKFMVSGSAAIIYEHLMWHVAECGWKNGVK